MIGESSQTEIKEAGKDKATKVTVFLVALAKALKASVLYPPDNSIPQELKQTCRDRLDDALDETGIIDIAVSSDGILFEDALVLRASHENNSISELLHRDGIRMLRFRDGLTDHEFERFFDAAHTAFMDRDKTADTVNLLWESDLDNIEYEAVDGFTYDGTEFELPDRFETPDSAYIEAILSETSDEAESANLAEDETKDSGENIGLSIGSIFNNMQQFSQEETREIAALLAEDQEVTVEFSAIDTLFDIAIAERENEGFTKSCDTLDIVFNRLLETENFPLLVYVLRKFKDTSSDALGDSRIRSERMRQSFHRCGDRIRISRLTEILNRSENEDIDSIRSYLEELDWSALSQLLWMLGELEFFTCRKMVCDLLIAKGQKKPELLAAGIYDPRWYVVRNTAIVLGEVGTKACIKPLRKATGHEDERVRREAALALCKLDTDESREALIDCLSDETERVRLLALGHFSDKAYAPAYEIVSKAVENKEFDRLSAIEQKELLKALASTGGDESLDRLKKIVTRRSLFGSETIDQLKEMAVDVMVHLEVEEVDSLLERWAGKRGRLGTLAKSALIRRNRHHSGDTGTD